MKPKRKFAVVTAASTVSVAKAPQTREERLQAAIESLGTRWVLHTDYQPRVRVGSFLTAWCADFARQRATETGRPAA